MPLGVAATSGSEQTAGRSRLTSNRRFASGRRPGWLRPREVRSLRISANRSSLGPSRPPAAHPPTGASSCRPMTNATRFNRRIDDVPVIDIPAFELCRTRPTHVGELRTGTQSARDARKTPTKRCGAFRETRSGRPGRSSRGSQVVHQPEDRCSSAIDRAILSVLLPHEDRRRQRRPAPHRRPR